MGLSVSSSAEVARHGRFLTDARWGKIRPLLRKVPRRRAAGARAEDRKVLEGILWILRSR